MKAAWYERQGSAADVIVVGEMPDPEPDPGEVRVRVVASGVNPGDVKKRQDAFGLGMSFARVIPHSDGAGVIDRVGESVSDTRVGERVWCYGAQSYRPFGTAAEFVVVPSAQAVHLADEVSFEQGACLGIPGLTAHRAVNVAGPVSGRTVLVQGGAGAVGQCAVALARHAGARVIATARSEADVATARRAGAHEVVRTDGLSADDAAEAVRSLAPGGIDHVVEVAFHANIDVNVEVLRVGGSVASYASGNASPAIPFWTLVFKNVRLFFLGSDDFPVETRADAARTINDALEAGWMGLPIGARYGLESVAGAHEAVEERAVAGRVIVTVRDLANDEVDRPAESTRE